MDALASFNGRSYEALLTVQVSEGPGEQNVPQEAPEVSVTRTLRRQMEWGSSKGIVKRGDIRYPEQVIVLAVFGN